MKNMPQNGQKRQKVQKPKKCTNENWPIFIPCDVDDHFWWSKQAKNTQKQPYLVGLSENRWKNTKNAISQKGLAKRFWKLVKFMSYMCTLRIKSKQTSYRKVRLDVFWGKCARTYLISWGERHEIFMRFIFGEQQGLHRSFTTRSSRDERGRQADRPVLLKCDKCFS